MKYLSFILALISIIFCSYCVSYAYYNNMWYELFATIGGGVLMVYCCKLLANTNTKETEEDFFE